MRVVRSSNRVEVVLLHEANVSQDGAFIDYVTGNIVMLVQVRALEGHRAAIHAKLPILDFYLPDTDAPRDHLLRLARLIFQGDHEVVQPRCLRAPEFRASQFEGKRCPTLVHLRSSLGHL